MFKKNDIVLTSKGKYGVITEDQTPLIIGGVSVLNGNNEQVFTVPKVKIFDRVHEINAENLTLVSKPEFHYSENTIVETNKGNVGLIKETFYIEVDDDELFFTSFYKFLSHFIDIPLPNFTVHHPEIQLGGKFFQICESNLSEYSGDIQISFVGKANTIKTENILNYNLNNLKVKKWTI